MSVVSTRGILLRSHAYSESSRVLRFLTEGHGVVGVMARGVRSRSGKGGGGIDLFAESDLVLHVRPGRDLQTLRDAAIRRPRRGIGRHPLRLAGAGLLAEIVLRHHDEGPDEDLFPVLGEALDRIDGADEAAVVPVLLVEGWRIVEAFGFPPMLDACVRCGRELAADEMGRFDLESGGMRCAGCSEEVQGPRVGPGARDQLRTLLAGEVPDALHHLRGHLRLLTDFVMHHLSGNRALESLAVLWALLPPEPDAADAADLDPEADA